MILLGLVLTALCGWLLTPRRWKAHPLEGLALGFLLVAFGVSVEMFLLGAAGVLLNGWIALLPWLAGGVWLASKRRPWMGTGFRPLALLPLGAAAAVVAAWLPYERTMPLTSQSWDAWAIWLFKAKAFFVDGGIAPYLARAAEFTGQPGYPLLTPLYSTYLYTLAGGVTDTGAKLASPYFYLAMLGAFHFVVRRAAGFRVAAAATTMLALTPMLQSIAFDLAGYADTALAAYGACAAGFGYIALRDGERCHLAAAVLAGTAAAWTKNEGQFFLAGLAGVLGLGLLVRKRGALDWAILVAPPALLLGAWSVVRSSQAVEAAGFTVGLDFHPDLFTTALRAMLRDAFTLNHFDLAFLLLPAGAAAAAGLGAPRWFWMLPGLAAWQFLGALMAYATGRNDLAWWLETSADRLLSQIAPLCLLTAAVAFGLWFDAQPKPATVRPSPKAKRKRA